MQHCLWAIRGAPLNAVTTMTTREETNQRLAGGRNGQCCDEFSESEEKEYRERGITNKVTPGAYWKAAVLVTSAGSSTGRPPPRLGT